MSEVYSEEVEREMERDLEEIRPPIAGKYLVDIIEQQADLALKSLMDKLGTEAYGD